LRSNCDEILRVEDVTQLALKLFEVEKRYLLEEKEEYSCAIVVVITPGGRYYEEVEFDDEAEMDDAYGAIVKRAKNKNATAIITINTAREQEVEGELGPYWWGKLAAENQPKCLFLTVSGPTVKPRSISLPFSVQNDQVILGTQTEFEPTIVNMLPNWP
jgi:hypothetical protein